MSCLLPFDYYFCWMSQIRAAATEATDIVRRAQKSSAKNPTGDTIDELCAAIELLAIAVKYLDKRLDKSGME